MLAEGEEPSKRGMQASLTCLHKLEESEVTMSDNGSKGAGDKELEAACYEALERVVDPELGMDVVSLGLIYRLEVKEGIVEVDMTMTSVGCPVAEQLLMEANNQILKVPGVQSGRVNLVWSPPWSPEMMSLEAKMALGFA